MTPKQVGELLGVDRHEIYVLARDGRLPPPIRVGKRLYFRVRALVRHLTAPTAGWTSGAGSGPDAELVWSEDVGFPESAP
jgi:hypothetical protein